MQNTKFFALLIISAVLAGTLCLSPAIYSLMNWVIIESSGQISIPTITAASGYWQDIQAATDWVVARGGIGNVYIPEGTFDFVNVGEDWTGARVVIPAGVSLFGTPTERTSGLPYDGIGQNPNDQVVEWKTVLVMPWEVPDGAIWFAVEGWEEPNKPFRFSDIKLVGWRFFDNDSETRYTGLRIWRTLDFRVDHCHFQDLAGSAINCIAPCNIDYNRHIGRGVIDHCILANTIGRPYGPGGSMELASLGYGVSIGRWACDVWDYDITNIFGQYTNYTVFMEDNYFSKWRHCVASNHGVHYVFRHNTVDKDYGFGSVDAHGSYADASHPYAVGTRAIEVYNNLFRDRDTTYSQISAILLRGGAAVIFNNTFSDYAQAVRVDSDLGNYAPYCPQCHVNQAYIWNNSLGGGIIATMGPQQDVHYFLRAPNMQQDGFEYEPYPYPHLLTVEAEL